MNLLPLALGLLAWQFFGKKNNNTNGSLGSLGGLGGITNLLSNPDALSMLTSFGKLSDKKAGNTEKTAAIIEMLSNPVIFEFAKNFFSNSNAQQTHGQDNTKQSQQTYDYSAYSQQDQPHNQQQDNQQQSTPATDFAAAPTGQDFFKPVEKVAGVEVSKKLYHLYDNWYIKK